MLYVSARNLKRVKNHSRLYTSKRNRGGIQRAPKVSIEGRLHTRLSQWTDQWENGLIGFSQETQVAEDSISSLNTATGEIVRWNNLQQKFLLDTLFTHAWMFLTKHWCKFTVFLYVLYIITGTYCTWLPVYRWRWLKVSNMPLSSLLCICCFTLYIYVGIQIYVCMYICSRNYRGGIQRATKISIEARLLGFLNYLTNERTVPPGFLKKHR